MAAAIHALIFDHWGLSYTQVATTADVVQGGVELLLRMTPTLVGVAIGIGLNLFRVRVLKRTGHPNQWAVVGAGVIIQAVLMAVTIALDSSTLVFTAWLSMYAGFILTYIIISMEMHHRPRWSDIPPLLAVAVFLILVLTLYLPATHGFSRNQTWASLDSGERCRFGEVLWSGAQSIVARCETSVLVVNRERVTIYSDRSEAEAHTASTETMTGVRTSDGRGGGEPPHGRRLVTGGPTVPTGRGAPRGPSGGD